MRDILRKLNYLFTARNRRHAALLFVMMIVGSLLEVIGIGAIPAFVALIASPEVLTQYPIAERLIAFLNIEDQAGLVIWGAGALVVIFIVKGAYKVFLTAVKARFTQHRRVELQRRLLRAYLHGPYPYHLGQNSTRLLHTLDSETGKVVTGSFTPILTITMEGLVLVMTVGLMFAVEPVISLAVVFMLAVVSGTYFQLVKPKLTHLAKTQQKHHRRQFKTVQQGLHGIKDTKVLGRESYFLDEFQISAYVRAREARHLEVIKAVPRLLLETVVIITMLAVSALMVAQGREVALIIPVLTLLAVAAVRLIPLFQALVSAFAALQNGAPALQSVYEDLMQLEKLVDAPAGKVQPMPLAQAITLENLHFQYPSASEEALRGVTLTIPRGAAVAFVGPSGAGKTTIVDLVLGLLDPTHGRVLVDGRDIRENVRGWQAQVGYIPQHIYLTDDTLRRNVAFGRLDKEIDDAQVWASLEAAQLREFVESLPEGLDTIIGERGVRLSGGQRQRIGIARALYHRPAVIVMDEATSALDNETERLFVQALDRLQGEHTLIVIAHRLSTVRNCDTLYLLQNGELVAEGSYDELLATSRDFRQMAREPEPVALA
jgi:ATP-binding cassette, subfamily B, bacterial PglK